jgi:hypothetical protein
MTPETLRRALCERLCTSIAVTAVPAGYAVSSPFTDRSGDPIEFYAVEDARGLRLEDDGDYLTGLIASGIDIDSGAWSALMAAILHDAEASRDAESYEIRTSAFHEDEIGERTVKFISALIRIRDLKLLTRQETGSTFRHDALAALHARFNAIADINERVPVGKAFSDFPSDAVILPRGPGTKAAIYFVSSNEHLLEADLLRSEAQRKKSTDFTVIALIEDLELPTISKRKFQRAQNRGLVMPIYRGDEDAAVERIAECIGVAEAA